ncbi:GYD domain-containing protein [Aliifodinibius sp. S!AR15-10]|nr:GYD domain-containing protein [Aliifodinibius sp. S!AR15-10]
MNIETLDEPSDFTKRASTVKEKIKEECPNVTWKQSYVLMGSYDILDILESNNQEEVEKAAMIIRIYGHSNTETFAASKWDDFLNILK